MEGLPKDIDLSFLIGRFIEVVKISKYQVHYSLNQERPARPDVLIEIGGNIIITDNHNNLVEIEDYRTNGNLLCLLLGLTIEQANRRDDGGLLLNLSSGFRLEVPIDTPQYECFVIHIGDTAIVG